jgi:hypothetical protein
MVWLACENEGEGCEEEKKDCKRKSGVEGKKEDDRL